MYVSYVRMHFCMYIYVCMYVCMNVSKHLSICLYMSTNVVVEGFLIFKFFLILERIKIYNLAIPYNTLII